MIDNRDAMTAALAGSIGRSEESGTPYRHWILRGCIPDNSVDEINALPISAPTLDGISGKRELHNATRSYFDVEARQEHPVAEAFASAFQSTAITTTIASKFGAKLDNTYLRIEYALDVDGFWLEPHTDLGVKMFTMLLYLSRDPDHSDLGTDIYDAEKQRVGRSPFAANTAMVFIPSNITYHGFEPRRIEGVRRSIIVNYVTADWRAREQLAYPDAPIRA